MIFSRSMTLNFAALSWDRNRGWPRQFALDKTL
jgi:hypothetical protein